MLRQAAFIYPRPLRKGALHCHTTRSDGSGTPEEVLRLHAENGYDFVALTDHRFYNFASYIDDPELLVLPGMEIDANFDGGSGIHCFHTVCIGPQEGNRFLQDQRVDSLRVTSAADFQPTLDAVHAKGNLTIYCHPQWSRTPAREFEDLRGNIAVELWNSGCVLVDDMDVNNEFLWDELLMGGHRLFGVATDDGHRMQEHCHGWVMVNAENTVPSILAALQNGAFYASTGPQIHDFRVEAGKAIVECSEAAYIAFFFGSQPGGMVRASAGQTLCRGEKKVEQGVPYVRATVVDACGRRAWTNPIFFDRNAAACR